MLLLSRGEEDNRDVKSEEPCWWAGLRHGDQEMAQQEDEAPLAVSRALSPRSGSDSARRQSM